ncbi:MAG: glycosyltransferase [PVC group bacterium]|nr:glycosyltransferase [PVC group bacterium]
MKILIIHASAGAGHRKAAEALSHSFTSRNIPNAEILKIDALDYTNPFFKKAYPAVYMFLVRYVPLVWGIFFDLLNFPPLIPVFGFMRRLFNGLQGRPLIKYILKEQPEVVICVHFFSAQLLARLKEKGLYKGLVVCGVTDFGVHQFWINKGTDYYFVASDLTKEELINKGVPSEKIRVTGIPIEEKFRKCHSQESMREKLGIDTQELTILVTSGGFGVGPIEKIVDCLDGMDESLQMLIICGKNAGLQELLAGKNLKKKVKVFGYVTNMDECMNASDLIISKSGGLTVSESLAKGLPMIIIRPIPGQETRNAEIIEKYNIGTRLINIDDIIGQISSFLSDDQKKLKQMKENTTKIAKPDAAENVSKWVIEDLLKKQ